MAVDELVLARPLAQVKTPKGTRDWENRSLLLRDEVL